jgi:glycosyltransferase involved in cell wall biosynthesis
MLGNPKLSVLMPVYNGEKYLVEAADSILAQTEPDFEFIVLDDGSSDDTPWILDRFQRADTRVRIVQDGVNLGVAARLNQGLSLARADLIARMDADDVSLPHRFATQLAHLEANPDVILLGARVIVIDPDGDELCEMGSALTHAEIDAGLMRAAGQLIYDPSVMYRKSAALAGGGYDESYRGGEDLDFFLRMSERGRIENLAAPLVKYREHFTKVGFEHAAEQEQEIVRALSAARARRGLQNAVGASSRRLVQSPPSTMRKWAWWALNAGKPDVARKHAARAFAREPFNAQSLKTLYCAVRGH